MTIIIMGVSGCGKTTIGKLLSDHLNLSFLDGDNFHPLPNILKMASGQPLTDEDRQPWLEKLAEIINDKEKKGGCVLACSALKQSYRNILSESIQTRVQYVYLKGEVELIAKRLAEREGHFMPKQLLNSQFETLEEPQDCIITDIDDTPIQIVKKIIPLLDSPA